MLAINALKAVVVLAVIASAGVAATAEVGQVGGDAKVERGSDRSGVEGPLQPHRFGPSTVIGTGGCGFYYSKWLATGAAEWRALYDKCMS